MGNPGRFRKKGLTKAYDPATDPDSVANGARVARTRDGSKTFVIKDLPPATLIPYARNTKVHDENQIAKLKASIKEYGFDQPIVVDGEMVIIKGHGRHLAATALGMETVPVIVRTDLTPQQVKAARIADNKISLATAMDDDMLILEVEELKMFAGDTEAFTNGFSADLIGFGEVELKDFEDELAAREAQREAEKRDKEDDKVPAPPKVAETKPGDVYEMGAHRLVCGSSLNADDLNALLLSEEVDQLVTDPPYGVDYKKKQKFANRARGKLEVADDVMDIDNDAIEDYRAFFSGFLSIVPFREKNTIYIAMATTNIHLLVDAMIENGMTFNDILVWLKNSPVPCKKDHNAMDELVVYGWKGSHDFYGDMALTTVYEFPRPAKNEIHPTMKPVGLFEAFIKEGSKPGAVVYDSFGGSGTTLVACENTGRKARLMELSPGYCDVIVKRWEEMTGKKAVRHSVTEWRKKQCL